MTEVRAPDPSLLEMLLVKLSPGDHPSHAGSKALLLIRVVRTRQLVRGSCLGSRVAVSEDHGREAAVLGGVINPDWHLVLELDGGGVSSGGNQAAVHSHLGCAASGSRR